VHSSHRRRRLRRLRQPSGRRLDRRRQPRLRQPSQRRPLRRAAQRRTHLGHGEQVRVASGPREAPSLFQRGNMWGA